MFKNVASQKIPVFVFDATTSLPKTGDAANLTLYVSKDHGAVTALADTSATEMDATNAKGMYLFDVAQAETNADVLSFTGKSSTANMVVVPVLIYTRPPNFSTFVIDATGNAKIQSPIKRGQAITAFPFIMFDSTTHAAKPGVSLGTIVVTRAIDGGSDSAGTLGAVTAQGNGVYLVNFGTGDTNGSNIVFKASATGCDQTIERLYPES